MAPAQQAEVGGPAFSDPVQFGGDGGQAEQARAALPGGLRGQVTHHPRGLGNPARVSGQRRDQAGPGPRAKAGEACR